MMTATLQAFYRAYYDWVKFNVNPCGFTPRMGLCRALDEWVRYYKGTMADVSHYSRLMKQEFYAANLDVVHPFNTCMDDYNKERRREGIIHNHKRIEWVINHM